MDQQIENSNLVDSPVNKKLYRQAVGSLMYLMIGRRPDLCFVRGRLSQYMEKRARALWAAVKSVFRYIAGTLSTSNFHAPDHEKALRIVDFSDSDWAGCKIERKSTLALFFLLHGDLYHGNLKNNLSLPLPQRRAKIWPSGLLRRNVLVLLVFSPLQQELPFNSPNSCGQPGSS